MSTHIWAILHNYFKSFVFIMFNCAKLSKCEYSRMLFFFVKWGLKLRNFARYYDDVSVEITSIMISWWCVCRNHKMIVPHRTNQCSEQKLRSFRTCGGTVCGLRHVAEVRLVDAATSDSCRSSCGMPGAGHGRVLTSITKRFHSGRRYTVGSL